jgi:hypothetical protein
MQLHRFKIKMQLHSLLSLNEPLSVFSEEEENTLFSG